MAVRCAFVIVEGHCEALERDRLAIETTPLRNADGTDLLGELESADRVQRHGTSGAHGEDADTGELTATEGNRQRRLYGAGEHTVHHPDRTIGHRCRGTHQSGADLRDREGAAYDRRPVERIDVIDHNRHLLGQEHVARIPQREGGICDGG